MAILTVYSVAILFSCIIGAIVGLGGGVFVRPILDAVGYHDVLNISFFSSSAILAMAVVSTIQKVKHGTKIDVKFTAIISIGAIVGGILGNLILEQLVQLFEQESDVQLVQIALHILVSVVSIILTTKNKLRYNIKSNVFFAIFGIFMGALGAFLGVGGGTIYVPLFMILLGISVKDAAAYSIVIIFFSHLSRLIAMGISIGYSHFDLPALAFILPAAILGGLLGARLSNLFSDKTVKRLFIAVLCSVIALNIANGISILY